MSAIVGGPSNINLRRNMSAAAGQRLVELLDEEGNVLKTGQAVMVGEAGSLIVLVGTVHESWLLGKAKWRYAQVTE